jgi:hypothetical protein
VNKPPRIYDLVMTHLLDTDDFFIHRIQQHCAERGLNFFLVEPIWVESFLQKFASGEIWARVILNMHSEHHLPEDIFSTLIRVADQRGSKVIDPPVIAMNAFDKAKVHPRLEAAGLKVPYTVLVRREEVGAFTLTEEQSKSLGAPFVIKPNLGYGRKGLVLDGGSERDIARSQDAWPSPVCLLQEKIVPRMIHDAPAYFRVYYVFGTIWSCWWNCFTDHYRMLGIGEMHELGLERLQEIVFQVARLTGMNFFSTEIAQSTAGELVLIDYVNDQCHLLSQSANPKLGVPDELVGAIARRLVEGAQQLISAAR